ncbi:endonuclease [Polaribacter sp. Hel1_85]|uniref:endonuclease n=1 Tax=Polaribacter sp. Hel1_85 TaxID=1250005 RepID=UPI00052C38B5|nr:endonuclease [Polaribacter sp. Hel1_85]KGL64050.1 endonuclease I [Polaribacter sp. Hel1_85]
MIKKLLFIIFISSFSISFSQEQYYNDVNLQLTGIDLKDALAAKIIGTHSNPLSYTPGVWEASKVTDKDTDTSKVVLIYGWENGTDQDDTNDRTRDNTFQDGSSSSSMLWNREHVFSKSLANPSLVTNNPGAGTDAHNLRPADKNRNSERNNYKFAFGNGNSGRSSITYNGPDGANTRGWYPGDEWKGDVSRIIMYMYLRYGDQCLPTNVGVGDKQFTPDEMIDLFLKWNREDPVSDFEKVRNIYHENTSNTYAQGNRNPFIDNPFLATRIWGGDNAEDTWGIYTSSDTEAPSTPTNVTLSNITLTSIDVSWDEATDNIGVTQYQVYVNDVLTKQTTTATSASITGLETNTTYNFKVIAKDLINKSEASNIVTGKTLADTTPPSVPTNVTITDITDSSFNVHWSASSDNNEVVGYDIFVDATFKASTTATTYAIIGLSTTTTYSITVLAKDADDNKSAQSTAVNATTTDGASGGAASELFITEYVEGDGGTNKAIEIVNLTGRTVNLSGYVLKLERNGASVWTTPLALNSGTVQSIVPGDVFVVGNGDNSAPELQPNSAANPTGQVDLVQPNIQDTAYGQPVNFNGDDAVALFKDDVLIDIIGVFGSSANFAENVTLRRNGDISAPNTTFDLQGEWTAFPENTFDGIGSHTSTLSTQNIIFESFKMFPNPTNGNRIYFSVTEDATIKIYNVLGKLVQTSEVTKSKNSIDISDFTKGIYLLQINSGKQFITKKLIKN